MNALAKPMTPGSKQSSDDWCTPKWLCDLLGHFDLDPCSNRRSHVDATWTCRPDASEDTDGLSYNWDNCLSDPRDLVEGLRPWPVSVYVNPPYSNVLPWAQKLAAHEGPWCALLKLDPTTKWWATLMSASPQVAPFRKRIKFEGDVPMTANFPSVLVFKRWAPSDELSKHLWIARYA